MDFTHVFAYVLLCLLACQANPQQAAAAAASNAVMGSDSSSSSTTAHNLPGTSFPAADAMIDWIKHHGGQVNVVVRELPGMGRYTVAARDIKAGDILAAIPLKLCFKVEDEDHTTAAALLLAELHDPNSKYKPYLASLPSKGEVHSYYSFPKPYLQLIDNEHLMDAVGELQEELQEFWQGSKAAIHASLGDDVTFRDLQYTMDLLKTRLFEFAGEGELLLPVVDMANHYNGCPHSVSSPKGNPCRAGSKDLCVLWRAKAAVSAGEEVCNGYHEYMLQDRSLIQYGFLQRGDVAEEMSGLDMRGFNPDNVWMVQDGSKNPPFSGRLRKLKAERARLRKLHKNMTTTDLNASIQADLELDADGSFWKQVQEWRRQRVAAINREIQRLSSLIGDMDKSAATAAGTATVQDEAQHNQQEAHKESNPEADAAATVSGCSGVSDVEAAGGEEMERGRCEAPVDLVAAVESK